VQRRPAVLFLQVQPGAALEQQAHNALVTAPARVHERRQAAARALKVDVHAATLVLAVEQRLGDVLGKKANLIITKPLNSIYELPYAFGNNLIDLVIIEGKIVK